MQFTLSYRGPLKSNAKPRDKHELRKLFHPQLKALWREIPLNSCNYFYDPDNELCLLTNIGQFQFLPLVSKKIYMVAELDITFLRPESPGRIIKSGDIDNRLKTLLDSLKLPKEPDDLPKDANPGENETPFYVLLEDDNLITRISINTDRMLEEIKDKNEVITLIKIRTRLQEVLMKTIGLG